MENKRMKVKCMGKNRNDKGVIINYNLVDEAGNKFQATGQQIKNEIQSGRYEFINLQIDKAGRLVDKAVAKVEPVHKKQMKAEQKAKVVPEPTSKDIVRNFLKGINSRYQNIDSYDDLAKKLVADYNGIYKETYSREIGEMPKEVKAYFQKLVKDIEDMARTSYVEMYCPNEYNNDMEVNWDEFIKYSKLPESIVKFVKNTKCKNGIIVGLSRLIESKDIANFKMFEDCPYINYGEWESDYMIVTSSYDRAKEYMRGCVSTGEELDINVEVRGNELSNIFELRYLAESTGKDAKYFKDKLLETAKIVYSFKSLEPCVVGKRRGYTIEEVMQEVLRGWTFGLYDDDNKKLKEYAKYFMALEYGLISKGDANSKYYDKIDEIAVELAKEVEI